jgi:phosphoribosylglycinamide formyltransferase-1
MARTRRQAASATFVPNEPRDADRRQRLVELCRRLPDASAERAGVDHLAFKVGRKIFAYYTYDHHGDGKIALLCKAPPGEQGRLVKEDPARYFVPPYVGPKGWVGVRLDTSRIDWREVKDLAFAAYVLTAPVRLRRGRAPTALRRR